jgi:hypothetical protein
MQTIDFGFYITRLGVPITIASDDKRSGNTDAE